MDFYKRALELKAETIEHRRYFHQNAETGLETPKAQAYVMEKLTEYGLKPEKCGHGVTALIGEINSNGNKKVSKDIKGKVILLRADMDALPMPEESGESFACPTGTEAHACGHDFHAAMLLTAAKILKEQEQELQGTVKLMFQPAEETFEGCNDMINAGILAKPEPDVALAFHVAAGKMKPGIFMYNDNGTMMNSVDGFRIKIQGKGAHGAYPNSAIDPINIGVHIHLALQELIARECDPKYCCTLTIGHFEAGTVPNIIPDTAVLEGTIRTNDKEVRKFLVRRMKEVAEKTAEVYGGSAEIEMLSEVPPLVCDSELTKKMVSYIEELQIPGLTGYPGISSSASEDFAIIAEKVPSTYMYLSAGFDDERGDYGAHNPKVKFNEDVCPIGVACLVQCAMRWLNLS